LSKPKNRRKRRRSSNAPSQRTILASLARFRAVESMRCDGCGEEAVYHAPMWAEPDPYLISFWAALCEPCILDRQRVLQALRQVRTRGWARPGLVPTDDELPPRTPRLLPR
jgi:hypothetical protein